MQPEARSEVTPAATVPIPDDRLLLSEREAAAVLCISPRKLWELRMCGEVPCVRIGRAVRYAREDLVTWINARRSKR